VRYVRYEILHTLHPAFEDGTDRVFRNVGTLQFSSDAGEIPKRIHTFIYYMFSTPCEPHKRVHDIHIRNKLNIYCPESIKP